MAFFSFSECRFLKITSTCTQMKGNFSPHLLPRNATRSACPSTHQIHQWFNLFKTSWMDALTMSDLQLSLSDSHWVKREKKHPNIRDKLQKVDRETFWKELLPSLPIAWIEEWDNGLHGEIIKLHQVTIYLTGNIGNLAKWHHPIELNWSISWMWGYFGETITLHFNTFVRPKQTTYE